MVLLLKKLKTLYEGKKEPQDRVKSGHCECLPQKSLGNNV